MLPRGFSIIDLHSLTQPEALDRMDHERDHRSISITPCPNTISNSVRPFAAVRTRRNC
jgi:hypothetical protein